MQTRLALWPRFAVWIALALALGCKNSAENSTTSGAGASGSAGQKQYSIAVIPKGTTHEFWKSVHAGAVNAAEEFGNVKILWKGPLQENDRDGQISVVQDFTTKQVDGIVLAPLDAQALVPYVLEATEADVPVVIFDSGLADESQIVSYVATDNRRGGALAAQRMGEVLGGQGDVILLRYNPGSESTHAREEGFLETLKQEYPDINVLSSDEYAGTTPEQALDKATQILSRHKDEVDGIFAVCEPNATGVLGALEETELAGKVKFVAFDPNTPLIQGMRDGKVHGIVVQDPVKMGYEAVKVMMHYLQDQLVDKRINTGEHMATPENMNSSEIDRLLHPEQFEE